MSAAERYSHLALPAAVGEFSEDVVAGCVVRLMEPDGAVRTARVDLHCRLQVVVCGFGNFFEPPGVERHPSYDGGVRRGEYVARAVVFTIDEYARIDDLLAQMAGVR